MNLATGETRGPVPPVTRAAPEGRRDFEYDYNFRF
jgi:hypothetical protein